MLIEDRAILDDFHTLSHVAQLLQSASLVNRSMATTKLHRQSSAASTINFNDSAFRKSVADASGVSSRPATSLPTVPSRGPGVSQASTDAASSMTHPTLVDQLQLPKSCGLETLTLLGNLGRVLSQVTQHLEARINDHLVEFYRHMRGKELGELGEICTKRRMVPQGFQVYGENNLFASLENEVASMGSTQTTQTTPAALSPTEGQSRSAMLRSLGTRAHSAGLTDGFEGLLPAAREAAAAYNDTIGFGSTAADTHLNSTRGKTTTPARNGPLGKRLSDRRAAANALQSVLYFILESALTQTESMCAAVYINGMQTEDNHLSTGRTARSKNQGPSSGAQPEDEKPQFLHCVAKLHTEGKLPQEVSYSTMSTLTAVVQTGVGLNLRKSDWTAISLKDDDPREMDIEPASAETNGMPPSRAGRLPSPGSSTRRNLNVHTAVVVPVSDFGCLVIGDKRVNNSTGDFTVLDEHVAWSAAILFETLLTRYQRDLLLTCSWAPTGVAALRRFMVFPNISASTQRDPDFQSKKATRLVSYMSSSADGSVPRSLTMVRTTDEATVTAVPQEVLPRTKNVMRRQKDGTIHEEDLFQGAAQYIKSLESLWRQAVNEKNTLKTVMDHYDREMEGKQQKITDLEMKVRRLNARVVHLERHSTYRSHSEAS